MKILVTGGAGFIGSHLSENLLARGDSILVIDNYNTGSPRNLPTHKNLKVVEGSIVDENLVEKTWSDFKPEIVVHCAASYKDPQDWQEDIKTNVLGTVNVVKASQNQNVKRLIYFQTALCYGLQPLEQPITLNHPIQPGGSSYAYSKTGGEQYIELSGMDYITFRLANVYGPRNISGPLPTFYQRLSTDKPCFVMDTRRDFLFVTDLVRVVMKAIDGQGEKGAYHVSSGSDYSIKELFDCAVAAMKIELKEPVEVRPRSLDDAFSILLDPSKTEKDFQWKTEVQLKDGVEQAVEWYKKNPVTETFTHLKHEKK